MMRLLEGVTGLETIGGACPVQGAGWYAEGVAWYFRARSGGWTLDVSDAFEANAAGMPTYVDRGDVHEAEGIDPTAGYMGYRTGDTSMARRLVAAALCRMKARDEMACMPPEMSGLIWGDAEAIAVLGDYAAERGCDNLAACCRAGLTVEELVVNAPKYGDALPRIAV